jgi:hypothetical protein
MEKVLTEEALKRILGAAEELEDIRRIVGLDISVTSTKSVGDFTVCISDPETSRPPMTVYHFKDGGILARAGREKMENNLDGIADLFNRQNRRTE